MRKISIIITILLSIFSIGCKKTHCPAFPVEFANAYFPYSKNQELKFTNSQQEIRGFIIRSAENSGSWSYEWNCNCECVATSSFEMYLKSDSSGVDYWLDGLIGIYGKEGDPIDVIHISFGILSSECLTKTLEIEEPVLITEISKYLEDTIIIEKENNKIIKRVVIVKEKGLVSYTTADGEEWKLVE